MVILSWFVLFVMAYVGAGVYLERRAEWKAFVDYLDMESGIND